MVPFSTPSCRGNVHPTHYGHTLLGAFVGRSVGIDDFGRLSGLATRFTKTYSGRQAFSRQGPSFSRHQGVAWHCVGMSQVCSGHRETERKGGVIHSSRNHNASNSQVGTRRRSKQQQQLQHRQQQHQQHQQQQPQPPHQPEHQHQQPRQPQQPQQQQQQQHITYTTYKQRCGKHPQGTRQH